MRPLKKVVSALLRASLAVLILAASLAVSAEGLQLQNSSPSYAGYTFRENFEGDLSKWEETPVATDFEGDFHIVEDPDNAGNKVLYFTKTGVMLTPTDAYWPADGQMLTATFKMKFSGNSFFNIHVPFVFRDPESYICAITTTSYNKTSGLWAKYGGYIDGESESAGGAPDCQPFDVMHWFDVTVSYSSNGFSVSFQDQLNNTYQMHSQATVPDGKFPIGIQNLLSGSPVNVDGSKYTYYIDDINISFTKLEVDKNVQQKDVVVYYAGNSVYKPGDLISITGEQLGTTVSGATILKLQDGVLSGNAADAKYINETDYETYASANVDWATLQAKAVAGTERALDILQRSKLGVKVSIPDDGEYATTGMYAIKLTAAAEGGKDAIVIVNNPYISLLLHDDGAAATPTGWLRIAGYNLSLQDDRTKVSAIIIDKNGNRQFLNNADIHVDTSAMNGNPDDERTNQYYAEITLPDLAPGSYQIMLHNGYGGDLGWSVPYDFTVQEVSQAAAWRDIGTYNVKDYGAVGDSYHNDTAAIIQALNAAYLSGGGTVYLPAGFYRITDTLYLPNNVSLVGDGKYESAIFFDANNWVETPEAMVVFEQNVEIAELYFYGSIARTLFQQSKGAAAEGYVYFTNVRTMFDAWTGCSSARGELMEGYDAKAAQLYLKEHGGSGSGGGGSSGAGSSKGFATIHTGGADDARAAYISVTGCDFHHIYGQIPNNQCNLDLHADYLYLNEVNFLQWSKVAPREAGFFQNIGWTTGALNYYGNCYFANVRAGNSTNNNREILCTDGQPRYKNQSIQSLNDPAVAAEVLATERAKLSVSDYRKLEAYLAENQGTVFRNITSKLAYNSETANMIYVVKGQGAGQIREINNNILTCGEYSYFTVKNAFAVEPNRNSRIFVFGERRRGFLINSDFYNCMTVGVFGSFVDFVADGNRLDEAESGIRFSPSQGQNWYITERNTVSTNVITGHTNYMAHSGAGFSYASDTTADLAYLGIRIYGNQSAQGGFWGSVQCSSANRKEVIFENNEFHSDDGKGFRDFKTGGEGVYFRDNRQYDRTGNPATQTLAYEDALVKTFRGAQKNKYGSYDFMCDEVRSTADSQRLCGDVNNDGFITLRDAEIIRDHLAGKRTLEELDEAYGSVKKYADCDSHGGIDTRDVFEIYAYLQDPAHYTGRVGTAQTGSAVEEYEIRHKNEDVILDYSGVEEDGYDPSVFDLDYSKVSEED